MHKLIFLIIFPFFLLGESEDKKPISVVWEGSFMDLGSLSQVNRAFTEQLMKMPQIKLSRVGPESINGDMGVLPKHKEIKSSLALQAPPDTQVTVRLAWPPNWEAPANGKWVLFQPWEFGMLPEDWVQKTEKVDEIWAFTQFVKKVYVDSGVPEKKIVIIPLGINPEIFHPKAKPAKLATNKKYKFLFLGGTIYRKGIDILLKSYQKAFSASDDVCLVIKDFGSKGPYKNQTNQDQIKEAQKLPNSPEILYLDQELSSEEIASLYTACDCFVSSYRGEGFGLPVLEAMACGLPVVVTKGGATDDFVTEEFGWFIPAKVKSFGPNLGSWKLIKDGYLLEPDADALSLQMRWLVEHPAEGKIKGMAASRHVREQWTWEKGAKRALSRLEALN